VAGGIAADRILLAYPFWREALPALTRGFFDLTTAVWQSTLVGGDVVTVVVAVLRGEAERYRIEPQ
jgi:hypothetical protein